MGQPTKPQLLAFALEEKTVVTWADLYALSDLYKGAHDGEWSRFVWLWGRGLGWTPVRGRAYLLLEPQGLACPRWIGPWRGYLWNRVISWLGMRLDCSLFAVGDDGRIWVGQLIDLLMIETWCNTWICMVVRSLFMVHLKDTNHLLENKL